MTKKLLIRSRSSGHNRFTENEGKAFHFLLKAWVPLITRGVDDGEGGGGGGVLCGYRICNLVACQAEQRAKSEPFQVNM